MSNEGPTYLVIGNVCRDFTPFGRKWGGTAMFGAVTAARLGARVQVLTSTLPEAVTEALPSDATVCNIATTTPLTFRHEYVDGRRELYITDVAPTLHIRDLPAGWHAPDIVHFGPVAQEIDHDLVAAFQDRVVGGSVQGWLRTWDGDGLVRPLPVARLLEWAPPVRLSFLSEEDIGEHRELIDLYRRHHDIVVLTDGSHGATVYTHGQSVQVPAVPVQEVDANGAGDVFAAAFLIRYFECNDAILAAQFAAAVASFHVEQIGIERIPSRPQAEERWQSHYGT